MTCAPIVPGLTSIICTASVSEADSAVAGDRLTAMTVLATVRLAVARGTVDERA